MSKKDYELIARVIADTPMTALCRGRLTTAFCDELATSSQSFDPERFTLACFEGVLPGLQLAEAA